MPPEELRLVDVRVLLQQPGKAGERAKRASFEEDEHTREESREMATDIIMATSTTKLTLFHSILLTRFTRFALASLKMRTISLRSAQFHVSIAQDAKTGKHVASYEANNSLGAWKSGSGGGTRSEVEDMKRVVNGTIGEAEVEKGEGAVSGPFFVEEFMGGDVCQEKEVADLPPTARTTEIRYYCGDVLNIASVHEDRSCHYIVSIVVPELCKHEHWEKKKKISTRSFHCHAMNDELNDE